MLKENIIIIKGFQSNKEIKKLGCLVKVKRRGSLFDEKRSKNSEVCVKLLFCGQTKIYHEDKSSMMSRRAYKNMGVQYVEKKGFRNEIYT